jgi:hypothetical protein
MLTFVSSTILAAWAIFIWLIAQPCRLIVVLAAAILFPDERTHRPNLWALAAWSLLDIAVFVWSSFYLESWRGLYIVGVLAAAHLMIIVAALLVITEENDVWMGYIRCNRVTGRDDRVFKNGEVVKSFPLLAVSGVLYIAYLAAALRHWHSESEILNTSYDPNIPIVRYFATVLIQAAPFATALKWIGLRDAAMEFTGFEGLIVREVIEVTNVSVLIGAINSYFRQRSEIRRLIRALGAKAGDIPVLQGLAARAPEEIKKGVLDMALHDSWARARWRAMSVAEPANILTFPGTMTYNLHKEFNKTNKQHALAVSKRIVENNRGKLERDFLNNLVANIDFQIQKRRSHDDKTIEMLRDLRLTVLQLVR